MSTNYTEQVFVHSTRKFVVKAIIIFGFLSLGPIAAAVYIYAEIMALLGLGIVILGAASLSILTASYINTERKINQERVLEARSKRIIQSRKVIHGDKGQIWITEIDPFTGEVKEKALHLLVKPYSNGHPEPYSSDELDIWQKFVTGGKAIPVQKNAVQTVHTQLSAPLHGAQGARLSMIDVLANSRTAMLTGPQNAGKTNVMHHLLPRKLSKGKVYVIDPHGNDNHWPDTVKVIGTGLNYPVIEGFMEWTHREVKARYRAIARDENAYVRFQPFTIIVDEWTNLRNELPNVTMRFIKLCLVDTRKVGIEVVICGHSALADGAGLKGATDMKRGLVSVTMNLNTATDERWATIDFNDGQGEHPTTLPPKHPDLPDVNEMIGSKAGEQVLVTGDVDFDTLALTDDDQKVLAWMQANHVLPEDFDNGSVSLRTLAGEVFNIGDGEGQKRFNGTWSKRLQESLARISESGPYRLEAA